MPAKYSAAAITCEHPEREHHAHGMCKVCYMRHHRAIENPDAKWRPEVNLNFTVKNNCIVCGDGYNVQRRKCDLHPQICDTCHVEYCECKAKAGVELTPLEDIAQMKEASQVPFLRARKMTLRLAGKKTTNSLPNIRVESPLEDRVIYDASR